MVGWVWSGGHLPFLTMSPIWVRAGHRRPLPIITTAQETQHTVRRLCVMLGYNGLELVVYGAVELGDVVLTFVGIHGLTGLEIYARLGWHFDGVRDCGILATGLH